MNFKELQKEIENLYKVQNPQRQAREDHFDKQIVELQKQKQAVLNSNPDVQALDKEIQKLSTQLKHLKKQRQTFAEVFDESSRLDSEIEKLQRAKRNISDYGQSYEALCYDFEASILIYIQRWADTLGVSSERFHKYWQHIRNEVSDFDYDYYDRINEFRKRCDALIELIQLAHGDK